MSTSYVGRGSRRVSGSIDAWVDLPTTSTIARGIVRFEGWALLDNRVPAGVRLVFNETTAIPVRLGIARPDVPAYLKRPDAAVACGWAVTVDLTPFPTGELNVHVVAQDGSGASSTLAARLYDLVDEGLETPAVNQLAETQHEWSGPQWDWDLPDFLGDTASDVVLEVSSRERMNPDDREAYLAVGQSALKVIRLAQIASGKQHFESILDMPCGHGRVLRWVKAGYPRAKLTACDLLTDGVDFCAETFGATPVYSSSRIEAGAFSDRYDLIFVGSLLTHVDVPEWDHLISLWHTILAPDGVLVVTTHGELVAERMRAGDLYGYPAASVTRMLRAYEHAGFAFLEEAPTSIDYGITIARADWTLGRFVRHPDFRVTLYGEALWGRHQDVAAVVKRPLTPS